MKTEEKIGCGKLIGDNVIGFICGKHKTINGNIMLCPSCQKELKLKQEHDEEFNKICSEIKK